MALGKMQVICQAAGVLLLCFILAAGCTAPRASPQDTPPPLLTQQTETGQTPAVTAAAVTTAATPPPQTNPAAAAGAVTATLAYGVTLSYPRNWMLEETGVAVARDYGREVLNTGNLYSPEIPPWRRMAGQNPDPSDRTILTIDVDDSGETELEDYLNTATVALQHEYGSIEITRHNLQLSISGFRAYRMDFDAKDLRGTYLFTRAGGRMYIFSFSNPTPSSAEVEEMIRSITISP